MAESPPSDRVYSVACPHCKKSFEARLLAGTAQRYRGFKCPHCKLFVPLSRIDDDDPALTQAG
jgi:hypothetical protein